MTLDLIAAAGLWAGIGCAYVGYRLGKRANRRPAKAHAQDWPVHYACWRCRVHGVATLAQLAEVRAAHQDTVDVHPGWTAADVASAYRLPDTGSRNRHPSRLGPRR